MENTEQHGKEQSEGAARDANVRPAPVCQLS